MTKRIVPSIGAAALAGAIVLLASPAFAAGERVQVGLLECGVSSGTNFLVGSNKRLACRFLPSGGGPIEHYRGEVTRIGIDLGETRNTDIRWAVFAPKTGLRPGALSGKYAGVSAEATAGVGLGANALLGGFERSIALNPLSVQTQTGVNIAAGIAGLRLTRQ